MTVKALMHLPEIVQEKAYGFVFFNLYLHGKRQLAFNTGSA